MGPIKRAGAALYLLASIVVLGGATAALAGPDPGRIRALLEVPAGHPDVEVTVRALSSAARAAAAEDPELMIEGVSARVRGRAKDSALIKVDAIDLAGRNLTELASALEGRVQRACEHTLGASGVAVRVRFFPAKTVTTTQEAS